MARPRFLDKMQVYPFWVFDVSGFSGNPLFSVFDPVLGFSSVTAPEISVETMDIQPGNWEYKRRVVKTADVGSITMARGVNFFASDFYNWISNAIRGIQPVRRNLVIVHFMSFKPIRQLQGATSGVGPELGSTALVERLPGRAWFLSGCVPTRYKAGGDFDASSSDVSIQELEVQPEYIQEITVATTSPVAARATSAILLGLNAGNTF